MKKILLLSLLLICGIASYAQTFGPDVVKRSIDSNDSTAKAYRLEYNFDYSVPLSLRTPALQLTFTQINKVDGKWKLTTPILIGYSYIFSYANGIIHQDSSITVETRFFFGAGANFGITPQPDGDLVTSVPVGAIVGYNRYGLFGGVDALTGKPVVAVSVNLLNVPILQSLTRFNIGQY